MNSRSSMAARLLEATCAVTVQAEAAQLNDQNCILKSQILPIMTSDSPLRESVDHKAGISKFLDVNSLEKK